MSVEFQFGVMMVARVAQVNVHISTEHYKMVKMMNFMLCIFYDIFL